MKWFKKKNFKKYTLPFEFDIGDYLVETCTFEKTYFKVIYRNYDEGVVVLEYNFIEYSGEQLKPFRIKSIKNVLFSNINSYYVVDKFKIKGLTDHLFLNINDVEVDEYVKETVSNIDYYSKIVNVDSDENIISLSYEFMKSWGDFVSVYKDSIDIPFDTLKINYSKVSSDQIEIYKKESEENTKRKIAKEKEIKDRKERIDNKFEINKQFLYLGQIVYVTEVKSNEVIISWFDDNNKIFKDLELSFDKAELLLKDWSDVYGE